VEVVRNGRFRVMCSTPAPDTWTAEEAAAEPPPGCSNALNLANMAARPRDLITPRELRGSEANAAGAAVERYRLDEIKEPDPLVSMIGN
jgi:type IV pilus biogenesis protein CpaD/CtpE